jgi:hypothetical protein
LEEGSPKNKEEEKQVVESILKRKNEDEEFTSKKKRKNLKVEIPGESVPSLSKEEPTISVFSPTTLLTNDSPITPFKFVKDYKEVEWPQSPKTKNN